MDFIAYERLVIPPRTNLSAKEHLFTWQLIRLFFYGCIVLKHVAPSTRQGRIGLERPVGCRPWRDDPARPLFKAGP